MSPISSDQQSEMKEIEEGGGEEEAEEEEEDAEEDEPEENPLEDRNPNPNPSSEEFQNPSTNTEEMQKHDPNVGKDQNPSPNHDQKPSVPDSITHLQSFNGALAIFLHHFKSLQKTLDSVNSAIDAAVDAQKPIAVGSELVSICRDNAGRSLRKYIAAHIKESDRLCEEVPEAIKLAPDPERLVLEAMGKFYMQGSRAFDNGKDVNLINGRRAGFLLLEFYVIAGCPLAEKPDQSVRSGARDAAVAWRSRLIGEGGVETASAMDASGLVLFIGAFGIPPQFRAKDIHSLILLSNLREKGDVLRRLPILTQRIPGTINVFDKHL